MRRATIILTLLSLLLVAGCGPTPLASTETAPAVPTVIPTSTVLPTPTIIPTPVAHMLYVDPSVSLGSISPLIYGSNYGPWLVVSFDMLPAAYDSGVTILRFPAGSWGDHNDVRTYQIDQFMDFAHKVGAIAMFNVRLLNGTPEQAAEMVRFTNIERKYNVQYWAIGNEPTLYNGELKGRGETYATERFNREWRTFAEAMKKVDPSIKLIGAEINQFSYDYAPGATTNFSEWDEKWFVDFLKANGDLVDIVSFHAIWLADVLGRMLKNGVFMANVWALTAKGGAGGLGLIGQYDVYPAYYTYQLFRRFGTELVYSSSDDPDVSIYAARRADGALTVMVVNLSLEEKAKAIRIEGQAQAQAETWLFDLNHKAENVGVLVISDRFTIPPESVTLYIIQ